MTDTERLDWIKNQFFQPSWNGVIDSGSKTNWTIWCGWRHVTQHMEGVQFRDAIDKAMMTNGY